MTNHSTHSLQNPILRRLWKPAAITGAGGIAVAAWFDEIMTVSAEIIALIFVPIMAGVIFLLDILMFKSRMPRHEDMENTVYRGAKK